MAHRGVKTTYGDLSERREKLDAKYDQEVEKLQVAFIEKNTGEQKPADSSFKDWLKNGQILCKLMNSLVPGSCKNVNTSSMAFKQMENISTFLNALPAVGIRTQDAFQTADLFEGVNMFAVQVCLENVRRAFEAKAAGKPLAPVPKKVDLPSGSTTFGHVVDSEGYKPKQRAGYRAAPKYDKYTERQTDDASYGDLAERKARLDSKYDPELEKAMRTWIQEKTGEAVEGPFHDALKDGTVLCKLANALKPGSIPKVHSSGLAFKQMENISNFVQVARDLGVRPDDVFQTPDLYEGGNMTQVLQTLSNLQRLAK